MKTLLVLLGPTGVGKTDLSLSIAEALTTSIVNADSRQLYRDIPIGTAAPTPQQLARVPHHFVGILPLDEYYSAARFEEEALNVLQREFETHDVVLLSGGSMLYLDAVCKGIDDIPTVRPDVRQRMRQRLADEGLTALAAELTRLDPTYAAEADLCNPKRVVHALEIITQSGRTYSSFRTGKAKHRPFRILKIGLDRPREELFSRINNRVDAMLADGLLDEVRRVYPLRHLNALNTVGYKELFLHLSGEWTLPFALDKIRRNTRVYAKKQLTWFRRDDSITWFHPDDVNHIKAHIRSALAAE